jgi:hypothetical protein
MKSNSALPGGYLKSKPTWPNAFGCSAMSAFLFSVAGISPGRVPLIELEIPGDSPNFQLIEDYWHWFWNWR